MAIRFRYSTLMKKSLPILLIMGAFIVVISAAGLQRAQRGGAIRDRIRERVEEKKEEAKDTKARNERPPTEERKIAGLNVAIWKPLQSGKAPLIVFSHGLHGCNTQSTYSMQRF